MLSLQDIIELKFESSMTRCKGCTNHCLLTINRFTGGRQFVSGNRCERGLGKEKTNRDVPNLYAYKNKRLFDHYKPLSADKAYRGKVGIPRVLNMYENYPYWFTFFTEAWLRSRSFTGFQPKHLFTWYRIDSKRIGMLSGKASSWTYLMAVKPGRFVHFLPLCSLRAQRI